ncbi:phosphodiester glycosidase family protein [bacterium]|nr:phosphodiester glycosidase family protein [bacterium]MBU1025807.1 phosphodiester glycosidase family protein [bacterium]
MAESPQLVEQKDFGDGLIYSVFNHENTGNFYFVKLKLSSQKWQLTPTTNEKGVRRCGTVKELALRYNPDAQISVNASFFDTAKYPIGTVAIDGEILSLDNRKRTSLGIKTDGSAIIDIITPRAFISSDDYFEPIWIWGYNQPTKKNAIIAYNSQNGDSVVNLPTEAEALIIENNAVEKKVDAGKVAIPKDGLVLIFHGKSKAHLNRFKTGSSVTLGLVMPREWENTYAMVTGGPRLINNARIVDLKDNTENFESGLFKPHRRTIAGLTWNDEVFIAVFPNPVTYENATEILLTLNVKDAMGLDGGSSSSLWVNDQKLFNGPKNVPVALSIVPRDTDKTKNPLPYFENKYWN